MHANGDDEEKATAVVGADGRASAMESCGSWNWDTDNESYAELDTAGFASLEAVEEGGIGGVGAGWNSSSAEKRRPETTWWSRSWSWWRILPGKASAYHLVREKSYAKGRNRFWLPWIVLGALLVLVFPALISHSTTSKTAEDSVPPAIDNNSAQEETALTGWNHVRLPDFIRPSHYQISLRVDMQAFRFQGNLSVDIQLWKPSSVVVLHASDLHVPFASIAPRSAGIGGASKNLVLEWVPKYEQLLLHSKNGPLAKGDYTLHMAFRGNMTDSLRGFYRSSYLSADGTATEWMALTQFEPLDARRAFPCFDEPAMKASFQLSITADQSYHVLANTPALTAMNNQNDNTKTITFKKTPKMSTYLVAYLVSKLKSVSKNTARGVKVSVWAQEKDLAYATYALDKGAAILDYYESFFGIDFPLEKQDMVAVPDFAAGAMENWGLVTYRDSALLFNPKTTPPTSKEFVAVVVAHELAHQWFGNLVSMKFWNDLWLNEGFATYVEYYGTNHAEPGYKMLDKFYLDTVARALLYDASNFTHSISVNVTDPSDIEQIFDDISYAKGSSIIRMVQVFLDTKAEQSQRAVAKSQQEGTTYFQRGLKRYLNRFAYGNAARTDLWEALEEEGVEDGWLEAGSIIAMMGTWTDLVGYPVVRVDMDGGALTLHQSRFLSKVGDSEEVATTPSVWTIPVSYGKFTPSSGSRSPTFLSQTIFNTSSVTLTVPGLQEELQDDTNSCKAIVKLNIGQTGFYRVQYPVAHLDKMIACLRMSRSLEAEELKDAVVETQEMAAVAKRDEETGIAEAADMPSSLWMPVQDLAGFVDDTFQLALAGRYPIESALNLFAIISQKQDDYPIWESGLSYMDQIADLMTAESFYSSLVEHFLTLVRPKLERVGWGSSLDANGTQTMDESHSSRLLRSHIVSMALRFGDARSNAIAMDFFGKIRNGTAEGKIDSSVLGPIFYAAVRGGDEGVYNWMQQRHQTSKDIAEQKRALMALGAAHNSTFIQRTLEYSISSHVRSQDASSLLSRVVSETTNGHQMTWQFLQQNWQAFMDRYGQGNSQFKRLLQLLVQLAPSQKELVQIQTFLEDKYPPGKTAVAMGAEYGVHRLQWIQANAARVEQWLQSQQKGSL